MEENLESFLKDHECFRLNKGNTRVVCTITGHEMPCSVAAIRAYMNGKKYKQLTKNGMCNLSKVAEYKKYLVPSKRAKNMLYCVVTRKEINNIPSHIENHVTGRKFQRDLKIYLKNSETSKQGNVREECSDAGIEESVEEDEEMEEEKEEDGEGDEEEEGDKEDEEVERVEADGFVGGIWYPNGMDAENMIVEGDDVDMDLEKLHEDKILNGADKSKTNVRKRKMKDSKKNKLLLGVNQKKSR